VQYVIVDLETTGLNCQHDRIIEIGAVRVVNGVTCEEFSSLVNPDCIVPEEITDLTGINNEMLDDQPFLPEIMPAFLSFIGDDVLVAHNAGFDKSFLQHYLNQEFIWVDTKELAKTLFPFETSYALGHLTESLRLGSFPSHRALGDARAAAALFIVCLEKLDKLDTKLLEILFRLSRDDSSGISLLVRDCYKRRVRMFPQEKIISPPLFLPPPKQEYGLFNQTHGSSDNSKNGTGFSYQEVDEVFSQEGPLEKTIPGYDYRPAQGKMARAVWDSFEQNSHLIVEAGTGIGKSLAYLIPSIIWSTNTGQKVVISTYTVNLQDQLWKKDIPLAVKSIAGRVNATVVKGRSHYLCLRKWLYWTEQNHVQTPNFVRRLAVWLAATETGDRDEINFSSRENSEWTRFAAHGETCLGSKCRFYRGLCFVFRTKKRADRAQLIITNHSLLLANASMNDNILPEYRYLVVDEAHHLEQVAEEQLGSTINCTQIVTHLASLKKTAHAGSPGILDHISGSLGTWNISPESREKIRALLEQLKTVIASGIKYAHEFFSVVGSVFSGEQSLGNAGSRTVRILPSHRAGEGWEGITAAGDNLLLTLREIINNLLLLGELLNFRSLESQYESSKYQEINIAVTKLFELEKSLTAILMGEDDNYVSWVEFKGEGDPELHSAPIEVKELLSEYLFSSKVSAVLTSATLSANDSFDYFKDSIGIETEEKHVRCLRLESPFQYGENVLLGVAGDLPDPSKVSELVFVEETAQAIIKLVLASRGRTLVLFTSHAQLKQVYGIIKKPLEGKGITVYAHGLTGSRAQLLEQFRKNSPSVILGANSFWEGVDVVGEALSSVIIVKLPFWPPSLPTVSARLDRLKQLNLDGFSRYSLPQAIIRFKQGFGRLIRSNSDFGVVCILDKRIHEKRYGKMFLRSLPKVPVVKGDTDQLVQSIQEWFEEKQSRKVFLPRKNKK